MYTDLRNDFILRMSEANISGDLIGAVINLLDTVSINYSISKTVTDIAVRGRDELARCAKMYIVCKQIEGCKDETVSNYWRHISSFINYACVPLDEIDANIIRKFLLLYKMDHDIGDRSLDHIRQDLTGWFTWMHGEGYISKNPCANVAKIKYRVKRKEALTLTELEHLRDACSTDRERALVEALYSTGCRISEMLSIKTAGIKWDLPQPECKVVGKGDKEGIVYFSPRAISVLKKYLATRLHDSEWLFCNDRGGGQMTRQNAEKIFRQLRQRAGLEDKRLTPHTMRHTTATIGAKVMPIQVVKEMMRHEKIDTTLIYAETSQDDVRNYHARAIV